ncbi:MAG: PEP-CTERM sorting domain-containing protein [Bryobacteraceae bacterium]
MAIAATAICASSVPAYGAGVQVSFASLANGDDILRYSGGVFTTPNSSWDSAVQGGGTDNWALTQSAATQLGGVGAVGINDNGFYPAGGARLYDVQLGFTNATPTGTSTVVRSTVPGNFTFNVPNNQYSQFALFGSGGSGSTPLTVTLNYATGSPTVLSVTLPDWYSGLSGTAAGAAGTYFALTPAMSRQAAYLFPGSGYQPPNPSGAGAYIYGLNLAPDSTRALTSVNVAYVLGYGGITVVNFVAAAGAVATATSPAVTPAPGTLILVLMGLSLVFWFVLRRQRKAF